jgi:Ca-activated chloride channel homolog
MWSLASPLALLLLPLPLLATRILSLADAESGALIVPNSIGARLEAGGASAVSAAGRRILPPVLWVALVLALAGPQRVIPTKALPASGRDIVLALDLSGSMEQKDFEYEGREISRLDAVKRMAVAFVRGRAGDRVGLVIFAKEAYFATPPTYDVEAVAQNIEEATIGISGRSTAISDGLGLALKRLTKSPSPSRVVILLSDGVNNAGTVVPKDAAELARTLGIRVHTIALGPRDMTETTNDPDVVDAETLRAVAEASGGTAFRVRTTKDLEAVGRAIDAMETSPAEAPVAEVYMNFWMYPAALAFLAALLILVNDRRRA